VKKLKFFYRLVIAYGRTPAYTTVQVFIVYEGIHGIAKVFKILTGVQPAPGENEKAGIFGGCCADKTPPNIKGEPGVNRGKNQADSLLSRCHAFILLDIIYK
jgi:hypothetical protein